MSDLLSIGASGVRAFNVALATVAENVSNSQDAGYTRRTVTLSEAAASRDSSTGNLNGVRVTQISRSYDDYKSSAKRSAASDAASSATQLDWMTKTQSALSDDEAGVGQTATAIFTAGDTLAANAGDTGNRKAFLAAVSQNVTAFNTSAQQLKDAADDIVSSATSTVASLNATLNGLDNVNSALHAVQSGTAAQANLLDQRDKLLDDLSTSLPVEATFAADGSATVAVAGGGVTLANSGSSGARFSVRTTTGTGAGRLSIIAITSAGAEQAAITSGALGGLVSSADIVAQRREELDTVANKFATALNAWSAQGTDSAGAAGTALIGGTGAAALTALVTDPAKVPAAGAGTTNGNLLALSALRDNNGVEANWGAMVTDQGRTVQAATTTDTAASSRAGSTAAALSDVTSVDADSEAADLVRWQQAYNGAAKVIQVANETMKALLDII